MKKILLVCMAFCLLPSAFLLVRAQSFTPHVIGSAGTFATSASGSLSWTIGEVMTETYSSANNFLTQGFHQPDTSYVISVVNPPSQNVSIYPNPVMDNLVVDFSLANGNHTMEIIDMQGRLLMKEFVPANQKQLSISFREFADGIYLLNIVNKESSFRSSYKINKAE